MNDHVGGCRRSRKKWMRRRTSHPWCERAGSNIAAAEGIGELLAQWEAAKGECDEVGLTFANVMHAYITGSGAAPSAKLISDFVSAHAAARERLAALYDTLWRMRAAIPLL